MLICKIIENIRAFPPIFRTFLKGLSGIIHTTLFLIIGPPSTFCKHSEQRQPVTDLPDCDR